MGKHVRTIKGQVPFESNQCEYELYGGLTLSCALYVFVKEKIWQLNQKEGQRRMH